MKGKQKHQIKKGHTINKSLIFLVTFGVLSFAAIYSLLTTNVSAAFSTITFKGASSATTGSGATSITFTKPAGTVANDLMLVQIVANGAAGNTYTPPSGWTLIRRDNTSVLIGDALFYKVASTSEPGSYVFTFSSSQQASGGIATYSGVDTANPIDAHSGSINLNVGSPLTAKSVTTTTPNDMLIFFGAVTSKVTVTPPTNMTQRWHATGSTSTTSEMSDQLLTTQGPTGDRVGTSSSSSSSNIGQLVALKPAVTGATTAPTPVTTTVPTLVPTATPGPSTPTPPVPPPGGLSIVAVGDLHCSQSNCKNLRIDDMVRQVNPNAILTIGDSLESGSYTNYLNYYKPNYGGFDGITYPTIGNHDGTGSGYYDYWNGRGVTSGKAGVRGKGWYSFNIGNWHIVSLNSNCVSDSNKVSCQPGSEQIEWLKADLAANTNKCSIAFMHQPFYTSGTRKYPELKTVFQTLYDYKVELSLAAHTHYYQRFYPQDALSNRDDVNGVTQLVVGTGGGTLANVGSTATFKNMARQIGKNHGILKLNLGTDSYSYEFVPAPGYSQTDSGSGVCK